MSSTRKLGTTRSNASSRRSSFGAASTTSSLTGARKVSNTLDYSSRTGKVSTTTPARPTITAPSTPSVSGPSSSSAAALKRNKHASQRTTAIQTQSSPPDSKPHTASLQWSSTKVISCTLENNLTRGYFIWSCNIIYSIIMCFKLIDGIDIYVY